MAAQGQPREGGRQPAHRLVAVAPKCSDGVVGVRSQKMGKLQLDNHFRRGGFLDIILARLFRMSLKERYANEL